MHIDLENKIQQVNRELWAHTVIASQYNTDYTAIYDEVPNPNPMSPWTVQTLMGADSAHVSIEVKLELG